MKRKDTISEAVKGAIKNGQSLNPSVNRLRKVSIGIKKRKKISTTQQLSTSMQVEQNSTNDIIFT